MKKIALYLFVLSIFTISCKDAKKDQDQEEMVETEEVVEVKEPKDRTVTFALEPRSGSNASGTVTFTQSGNMVKMTANISGLEPGMHAIHIHEKADCSAEDATSSGGHWNPTFEPHGKWGDEGGFHKGDIGNFEADENGMGSISMTTDQWCIGCGDKNMDILGKAIIVHQGADDFTSQPSGAAGARVSCGGIIE